MDEAIARYAIAPGQLTVHQDRGSPMIAHGYLDLMRELDVTCSHSRPRVSNDNAFSESQFKTQKYQPDYPGRFDSAAQARRWCEDYFQWYNVEHHHSGLAGFTPEQVFKVMEWSSPLPKWLEIGQDGIWSIVTEEGQLMKIQVIGIDLGKQSFHVFMANYYSRLHRQLVESMATSSPAEISQ